MRPQSYADFLVNKVPAAQAVGFAPEHPLPAALKPFQRDIVEWALRLGRAAIFAGTGTGKSIEQLAFADAVERHTGAPVLLLAPLAVTQQTCREAEKFGVGGVEYAKDEASAKSRIVVTNYDRIDKFDLSRYGALVIDESSVLKGIDSQIRKTLTEASKGIPYLLACTATPAPNDYVELGNHAEFLGVATQKEMLSMWFVHDGGIRATGVDNKNSKPTAEWRLKRHAEREFWRWVSTWAVMIRHPRDMGYDEPGYDLPPLDVRQITVSSKYDTTATLFPEHASTLSERIGARRDSIPERVKAAADIVNAAPDRQWLVWCHLNTEADALRKAIPGSVEVRGSDDIEDKVERLLGFADGKIRILLSKPSIAGHGLNLQGCYSMIFVGLSDSFESLFQAIRRCWRFGQTKPVTVYMISAEREGSVVANLRYKEEAAEAMAEAMAQFMRDLGDKNRHKRASAIIPHSVKIEVPSWL